MGASIVHPTEDHQLECIASTSEMVIQLNRFPSTITVPFLNTAPTQKIVNQLVNPISDKPLLSIRFMHLHGFQVFPPIDVYLNASGGSYSDRNQIGTLALYGLENASVAGPGLHESWDVGAVFAHCATQTDWSNHSFTLTFDSSMPFPDGGELMIGRVELYYLFEI